MRCGKLLLMFVNDLLNKKTERFKLEDNQEVYSNKKKRMNWS